MPRASSASSSGLLASNPLAGVRSAREANPKRPVTSWERFQTTGTAMRELAEKNLNNPARHQKWLRMELALVLAEATGRRLGAIRHLVWPDFNFDAATIRWRAEPDQEQGGGAVPPPPPARGEHGGSRPNLGAPWGPPFPPPKTPPPGVRTGSIQPPPNPPPKPPTAAALTAGAAPAPPREGGRERTHLPLVGGAAAGPTRTRHPSSIFISTPIATLCSL